MAKRTLERALEKTGTLTYVTRTYEEVKRELEHMYDFISLEESEVRFRVAELSVSTLDLQIFLSASAPRPSRQVLVPESRCGVPRNVPGPLRALGEIPRLASPGVYTRARHGQNPGRCATPIRRECLFQKTHSSGMHRSTPRVDVGASRLR